MSEVIYIASAYCVTPLRQTFSGSVFLSPQLCDRHDTESHFNQPTKIAILIFHPSQGRWRLILSDQLPAFGIKRKIL